MTKEKDEYLEEPPTIDREDATAARPASGRRYTLEPLRRRGAAALACTDIPGIEWIKLKEIRFFWGGLGNEFEIRRADDIFEALRSRGRTLPTKARIIWARFHVKFADSWSPRSVVVRPVDSIETARDEDYPIIERWLSERGFVKEGGSDDDAALATLGGA